MMYVYVYVLLFLTQTVSLFGICVHGCKDVRISVKCMYVGITLSLTHCLSLSHTHIHAHYRKFLSEDVGKVKADAEKKWLCDVSPQV